MARVVVLQRIIPSYRVPILRRISEELGWQVVFGRNVAGSNMQAVTDAAFTHGVEFRRWSSGGSSRFLVPVREILEKFSPTQSWPRARSA